MVLVHHPDDGAAVEQLATQLREFGIEPWLRGWEIGPGDVVVQRIEEGIANADGGLVVISARGLAEPWAQAQHDAVINHAVVSGKFVIPVVIGGDSVAMPQLLAIRQPVAIDDIEGIVRAVLRLSGRVSETESHALDELGRRASNVGRVHVTFQQGVGRSRALPTLTTRGLNTVLVASSNSSDHMRVAAEREYQVIHDAIKGTLVAHYWPQSSIDTLRDQILTRRPTIVHFIGRGTATGELVFVDLDERAQHRSLDAVARVFASRGTVKCVVLNACNSLEQAQAIATRIPIVIGVSSQQWSDNAAATFAKAFYTGVSNELSALEAFRIGQDALVALDLDPALVRLVSSEGVDPASVYLYSLPVTEVVDVRVPTLDEATTARLFTIATEGLRVLFDQADAARADGRFERAHEIYAEAHTQALELASEATDSADEMSNLLALIELAYASSLLHVGRESEGVDQLVVLARRLIRCPALVDAAWRHRLVETLVVVRQSALAARVMEGWEAVPSQLVQLLAIERGEFLKDVQVNSFVRLRMALAHERAGNVEATTVLALAILEDETVEREVFANALLVLGRALVRTAIESPEISEPLAPKHRHAAVRGFSRGLASIRPKLGQMAPSTRTTINEIAVEVQRCTLDVHGLVESQLALGEDVDPRAMTITLPHEGTAWGGDFRKLLDARTSTPRPELSPHIVQFASAHPRVSVVQWVAARFLFDLEEPGLALPLAANAHELLPGLGQALLFAELLVHAEREDEAAQVLKPFLPLAPDNPALLLTAAFALRTSQHLEACRCFERYFELEGAVPLEASLAYAELLAQVDREPEAVARARDVLALAPEQVDPLILFGIARILASAAPPGRRTRAELRDIYYRLSSYEGHPFVEQFVLELYLMLGAPPDLKRPDFERLIESGVVWREPTQSAMEGFKAWRQFQVQAQAAWRSGILSFDAFRSTASVETADVLERLLDRSTSEPVLVPPFLRPRVHGEVQPLAGKIVLLGDLEVHLLVELNVWIPLLDKLGSDGHVAIFADVWQNHIHAAVARLVQRNDRLALDRVERLRDLLDRSTKIDWVASRDSTVPLVSNEGAEASELWSLEALLATLAAKGWLLGAELEPLGINPERQRAELPSCFHLDSSIVTDLWDCERLEQVLECDAITRVQIEHATRKVIVGRVAEHKLGTQAVERAKAVRQAVIDARDRGRLLIVNRPHVELPPPVLPRWTMFRAVVIELRSWRQFLVEKPDALLLSADHATNAGSTRGPVGVNQTLAWTSREQKEAAFANHRDLGERILDFAELVVQLSETERIFETSMSLVEFGLSGALEAVQILELAQQHARLGLSAPRARKILDLYEWPIRQDLDSIASTQIHLCQNYALALWTAWCGDNTRGPIEDETFLDAFSGELAGRVASLAAEDLGQLNWGFFSWLLIPAIQWPLISAVDEHGIPFVHRTPVVGGSVVFSKDTPAGRLWTWLRVWIGQHHVRTQAWNLAVQDTVAFCAREPQSFQFARNAVMSLRLAVSIVSGADESRLDRPPLSNVVLLAFTCESPLELLAMNRFGLAPDGPSCSWLDILQRVAASDPRTSQSGVASATFDFGDDEILVWAEVPTALLTCFRCSRPRRPRRRSSRYRSRCWTRAPGRRSRSRAAWPTLPRDATQWRERLSTWAHAVAPDDARLAHTALRLAEANEELRLHVLSLVRALAESPARSRNDDPLGPVGWGLAADITFPTNLAEVESLLGEGQPSETSASIRAALPPAYRPGQSSLSPFERGQRIPFELRARVRTLLANVNEQISPTIMFSAAALIVSTLDAQPDEFVVRPAELIAQAIAAECAAERVDTMSVAQFEWRLLNLSRSVIKRLGQDRHQTLPPERLLELTWRLFHWWWRRLRNTNERERVAALEYLVRHTIPTDLNDAVTGFVLDPARFGPSKWNCRLASLLSGVFYGHVFASQVEEYEPDTLVSPRLEAELIALLGRTPTPAERAVRWAGEPLSPLGWQGSVIIRDLALQLLLVTQPGALSRLPRLKRNVLFWRVFKRGKGRLASGLRHAVVIAARRDGFGGELYSIFKRSSAVGGLARPLYLRWRYLKRQSFTHRVRVRPHSTRATRPPQNTRSGPVG